MRLWDRNLPGEVIWQFSNEFTYAPGHFSVPVARRKIGNAAKWLRSLWGLVAGESLPLT